MKITVKEITRGGVLTAMLAVSAFISIPLGFTPIPLTLQTMIVNLIALTLSPLLSFLTVLVYILLGLAGLPVFSGGVGGAAKLFGPTGGFIIAFLISAPLMSFLKGKITNKISLHRNVTNTMHTAINIAVTILIGMTTIYLLGAVYMSLLMRTSFAKSLTVAVLPFIPLDICKCIAASLIAVPLNKALAKRT